MSASLGSIFLFLDVRSHSRQVLDAIRDAMCESSNFTDVPVVNAAAEVSILVKTATTAPPAASVDVAAERVSTTAGSTTPE